MPKKTTQQSDNQKIKRVKVSRHKRKIRSIGVLTSGGDAPGMNAAIRAVVRTGIYLGVDVYGVEKGYTGLLESRFLRFELGSVANIIQRGGTVLKSDRCKQFHQKKYRQQAVTNLKKAGIDALVCIGGDGTLTGAHLLWKEFGLPVVGVPGTIDNDLFGSDITIGFDTAINTGLHAIDQIRDTASSHDRLFIIEVMGRNSGYIAVDVGIGGGADAIVSPETPLTATQVYKQISRGMNRGKKSSIIVVAEGKKEGSSMKLAEQLKAKYGLDPRVCILGHVQRGGAPSARDRKVASVFGAMAVRELLNGYSDFMTGAEGWQPQIVGLKEAVSRKKEMHTDLLMLAEILAT